MERLHHLARTFLGLAGLVILLSTGEAVAQTTVFTYQGCLPETNLVPDGIYEMQFTLFDDAVNGNQVGSPLTHDGIGSNTPAVSVTGGIFTVKLDFGVGAFPGADRYVEAAIKYAGNTTFTTVRPRQQLTSKPYAIRTLSAASADTATIADTATNAKRLGGREPAQYVQEDDPRLSDARPPAPDLSYYIQNTTSAQASANFNISGDGTVAGMVSANTFSANTQYVVGGAWLRQPASNLFVGYFAGYANSSGLENSFFGSLAGEQNSSGRTNSFFGVHAGLISTEGSNNSFFGYRTGFVNGSGSRNSSFGSTAGRDHSGGGDNSFFGYQAGFADSTSSSNSFFGVNAGQFNRSGSSNSFFGINTGGDINQAGNFNTLMGANATVGGDGLNHATAIGADSVVSTSNTVVLGRNGDTVRVPGSFVSIGTMTDIRLGGGGSTTLCRNFSNQISNCSSSLRYKTNIAPFFSSGLNLVSRLRPISFDWKSGGMRDIGFGAEEVAAINPLFVTYNSEGQVEGVKYDRLSVAFVNAFKEQQAHIERQQNQIEQQEKQFDALRKLLCRNHQNAPACR